MVKINNENKEFSFKLRGMFLSLQWSVPWIRSRKEKNEKKMLFGFVFSSYSTFAHIFTPLCLTSFQLSMRVAPSAPYKSQFSKWQHIAGYRKNADGDNNNFTEGMLRFLREIYTKMKIANSKNAETRRKRHSGGLLWQNNSTINRVSGKAESKIKQLEVEA